MTTTAQDVPFAPVLRTTYVEQQSRPTVLFRLILAIPHLILAWAGAIVVFILAIVGWFAALVTGELPAPIARIISQYVLYITRLSAYFFLITDRYPPFRFKDADYPVTIELRPGSLNRLAVLFRIFLALPAHLLAGILEGGWLVCSFVIWLIVLISGRMPRALYEATVAVMRFAMRTFAFLLMVTSAYPSGVFGDEPGAAMTTPPLAPPDVAEPAGAPPPPPVPGSELGMPAAGEQATGRLVLSSTARRLLILFIVLGLFYDGGASAFYLTKSTGVVAATNAGNAFVDARRKLEIRIAAFQTTVGRCNTQPEPFRCAQNAERDLVDALERFDADVDKIDFPSEVGSEADALRDASRGFREAIETLIAANSEQEYLELAQTLDASGRGFDAAVNKLFIALSRAAGG